MRLIFGAGETRPVPVHDKTFFIYGDLLCRFGLRGLSARYQRFCRYDRHREHDLRLLAVNARASTRGTIWIYGFWTGLNYVAAASDQTQAKIDGQTIVNEVAGI